MATWEQFEALFTGSSSAYGDFVQDRDPKAFTRYGKASAEQYQAHLAGKTGLGIVPVNAEGLCRFAAIDIDVDTIDHGLLYKTVVDRKLPLNVCRSKSGGAHLYLFTQTPGVPAPQIQQVLSRWATLLGYPQAEIFPKQKRSTAENHGNWINLPYFGGDATTRYAVGSEGALTLDEFINGAIFYDPLKPEELGSSSAKSELPPCLLRLQTEGVTSGYRNQALLNFAIFYRKSSPGEWQDKTALQNSQYFSPPLDSKEVGGVIQSASRTKYQYTCDSSPLRDLCDREKCATLQYGVGHMPWQESGSFDSLSVTDCRKLLTNPPRYIVSVNGKDITLAWEELYVFARFKSKVGEVLNLIANIQKQASWEQTVRSLLSSKTDIQAPDDASTMGLVLDKLHEFLVLRERATEREDLLRGLPIQDGDDVLFRASDFKRYLQGFKLDKVEGNELFLAIRTQGATHRRIRLNGRMVQVWAYPLKHVNEQTEEFKIPDFKKDLEEV